MKEFIMSNILICAVAGDLLDYKIRNPVIIAGWAAGICFNSFSNGVYGIFHAIFCIVITVIIGFPLFMAGGAGAGDIKLFSVIGGLYGLAFLAKVVMLFLIIAGTVSFVKLIKKRALISRVKAFIYYILHIGTIRDKYYRMERDGTEFAICLAPVIAAAYFITLFFMKGGLKI
ncbi:MAG: hypothetical protein HFH68_12315 [Lachnospiraceae bacterium]|nr:hypothetical protein [Lachnospiraceae bacterium]